MEQEGKWTLAYPFWHNQREMWWSGIWNKANWRIFVIDKEGIKHPSLSVSVNKHKPWIETTYHGIITENDDKVLLDPPLIALDKDAPLRYAGEEGHMVHTPAESS